MIILSLILCLGFCLRIYHLGALNLWFDEAVSVLNGRFLLSVVDKFGMLPERYPSFLSDIPIYIWYRCFGPDETALRFFSLLFGLLTIFLVFILAKMIFSKQVALFAAFLTAISPLQIYYSQELRTYTLVTFSSLLAVFFLLKALENNKIKFWLGYVFFNVLSIYLHYMTAFVLLAQIVFVLISFKYYKQTARGWILSNILILILILPWLINSIFLLKMLFESKEYLWIPSWGNKIGFMKLIFTLKNFVIGYYALSKLYIPVIAITAGILGYGLLKVRDNPKPFILCLCCLVIPPVSMFLVSQFVVWYVDRYVIVSSIFLYILIAYGLSRFKNRYMILCLLVLSCSFILPLKNYYSSLPPDYKTSVGLADKHDYEKACVYLKDNLQKDDIILYNSYNSTASFEYYFEKNKVSKEFLTNLPVILFFAEDKNSLIAKEFDFRGCKYRKISYEKMVEGRRRIWLVVSDWVFNSDKYAEKQYFELSSWMGHNYREMERKVFKGIVLYMFEKT